MIKFLHCADLHLDSPLSSLDLKRAEVRRNELRAAFTSLTLYARMNGIDFLLISGDLVEAEYLSRDTLALIHREFASLSQCKVIIMPGNHDPYTTKSIWKREKFTDNVYIFDCEQLSCFDFPEKNVSIYGYAFCDSYLETCPFENTSPTDPDRVNILMAHGELGLKGSKKCPIPLEAIEQSGFDYVALGHYHKHSGIKYAGATCYSYCGCLEGRGFDELGEKGAVVGAAEKKDGKLRFGAKFMRFSKKCYEVCELDVSGAKTNSDLLEHIRELISEKHFGSDTALRIKLVGEVGSELRAAPDFLSASLSSLFLVEIIDETVPMLDADSLKTDPTIRGVYFRTLEPMLTGDSPEERKLAAAALRLGLAAIAGEEL